METKKIVLPEGWEFYNANGNEIIIKEAKKELPKTWEGCYRLLEKKEFVNTYATQSYGAILDPTLHCDALPVGLGKPVRALMQLLVCREVYRQGWKPDWSSGHPKFIISYSDNEIRIDTNFCPSRILSFQSAEIRDKFLDNFRDLIEEAKELI